MHAGTDKLLAQALVQFSGLDDNMCIRISSAHVLILISRTGRQFDDVLYNSLAELLILQWIHVTINITAMHTSHTWCEEFQPHPEVSCTVYFHTAAVDAVPSVVPASLLAPTNHPHNAHMYAHCITANW